MVGKTIARIEERPTSPEYGSRRDDTLVIHFTDGTAMEVTGHSYEEVDIDWRPVDADHVARSARAAQGRREKERLARLQPEEWDALPAAERASRTAKRRAKMTPFQRAMEGAMADMAKSMLVDMNRQSFASTTIAIPVEKRPRARRS